MWEAGQVIYDHYQLKEKLGNNTGRQTWLAQDLESESSELVIIKLLTFGGNIQWDDVRLFEREAQILQQLNHDRIPKYKNYFSIDDHSLWFGLVEEYISGTTLKQLLAKGTRFGEAEVINIAQEVLQTLVYLHSFNPPILHRDIKPSNLLLGDDDKIYLVDFGAVQDSFASDGTTFTVVGTYGYAPLEQFGGKTVPASDLYALGITLIHLLTRTSPSNLPNKDLKIQFRDRVTVSPKLANWLDKMIAPAVERRYPTAISALKYLPEIAQELAPVETTNLESKLAELTNSNQGAQPVGSNIRIKQNSDFIEITIPGQGFIKLKNFVNNIYYKLANHFHKFIPLFITGGIILLFLKMIISQIAILILLFLLLFDQDFRDLFTITKIKCDRKQFSIINSFLGFTNIHKGITTAINDVSLNYISQNRNRTNLKIDSLIINTKSTSKLHSKNTYMIGKTLTEAELLWLVKELRNWLNNSEQTPDNISDLPTELDSAEPNKQN